MTLATDIEVLRGLRADCDFYAGPRRRVVTLDRVIAILEPLAGLSDAAVDAMLVQTSNLAPSWAGASDNASTDTEHDRHRLIASGYAALAASLTALRGQR